VLRHLVAPRGAPSGGTRPDRAANGGGPADILRDFAGRRPAFPVQSLAPQPLVSQLLTGHTGESSCLA